VHTRYKSGAVDPTPLFQSESHCIQCSYFTLYLV